MATESNGFRGKRIAIAVGVVLFVYAIGRFDGGKPILPRAIDPATPMATSSAPLRPAPRTASLDVDNRRLWHEYDASEAAADDVYRGKTILVRGVVAFVGRDFADTIVIQLASPNAFMNTRATVRTSQATEAARLSKGDRVALVCEARGRVSGAPSLDGCAVVEPSSGQPSATLSEPGRS